MIEKKIRIKNLEELINQPRLVKYDTYEFDELSYTCLLVNIKMLLEENKKYKEVTNKLKQFCNNDDNFLILDAYSQDDVYEIQEKLLDMLKEVEDKWKQYK